MIFKGAKGFRSGESEVGEFEGIAEKFNLESDRKLKDYNVKSAQYNDLFTTLDVNYLLKIILKES